MTDRVEDRRGILECKNTKIAASNRDVIHEIFTEIENA